MVAEILERLFDMADRMKMEKREDERKAVQECIQIINEEWYRSDRGKTYCTEDPSGDLEKVVYRIPGIKVYKDDQQKLFELDGWRFEDAEDVLQYMIDSREAELARFRVAARKQACEYLRGIVDQMVVANRKYPMPQGAVKAKIQKFD